MSRVDKKKYFHKIRQEMIFKSNNLYCVLDESKTVLFII